MDVKKSDQAKHLAAGRLAETQALQYLQRQGLIWKTSNYRCKLGELDLVLWDQDVLVVVEVRYRKNNHYGSAAASVTPQKQLRIIKATQHYVIMHRLNQVAVRFDVVALTADRPPEWIKNAFQT